jgi:hypothetical protein
MTDPIPQPDAQFLHRRKRVVARELHEGEIEAANVHSANLVPEDIITPEQPIDVDQAIVVDPTTLGPRRRRTSHHKIYRWSQFCTLLSGLLSGGAFICAIADEIPAARACAAPALVFGTAATILASQNSLSGRVRGWAIAAAVFAAAVLALTWIQPAIK